MTTRYEIVPPKGGQGCRLVTEILDDPPCRVAVPGIEKGTKKVFMRMEDWEGCGAFLVTPGFLQGLQDRVPSRWIPVRPKKKKKNSYFRTPLARNPFGRVERINDARGKAAYREDQVMTVQSVNRVGREHGRVLVAVSDSHQSKMLRDLVTRDGHSLLVSDEPAEFVEDTLRTTPDVVVLGHHPEKVGSCEELAEIRTARPELQLIIVQAGDTPPPASLLTQGTEVLDGPLDNPDRFSTALNRALDRSRLISQIRHLKDELQGRYRLSNLVEASIAMREVLSEVQILALDVRNVLLEGEVGTGKASIARAIHRNGPRRDLPFIHVASPAIRESNGENHKSSDGGEPLRHSSENLEGLIRKARGGSIFLEEVGTLRPEVQGRLLQLLKERDIRVEAGGRSEEREFRVIAATNEDLATLAGRGGFHADLLTQFTGTHLRLPPLRERREDIPLLVHHFIGMYGSASSNVKGIDPAAMRLLAHYDWPGNVRELENCIRFSVLLAVGETMEVDDLPERLAESARHQAISAGGAPLSLKSYEKSTIEQAMSLCDGDVLRAARMLGIGRSTLYRKMKLHGVKRRLLPNMEGSYR